MEFLEVPLYDDDVIKLLVRFGINLFFLFLFVTLAINPRQREREFAFTAVMLNVIVFFICFTMKKLELDLGLALGLFAIFGVLRYRTEALSAKQMTYLFIVIGIAVINSLANKKTSYTEVLLVNSIILAAAMLKLWIVGRQNGNCKEHDSNGGGKIDGEKSKLSETRKPTKLTVEYDRLEWLGEEHRNALLAYLKNRTGMDIFKAEIKTVDLLQNKATLVIWVSPPEAN